MGLVAKKHDGSGSGYGSGYGYGSGSGDGSGYGYGYGSGDGYGDVAYWLSCLKYWSEKWTEAQQARLRELQESRVKIAFWRSDGDGCACNGGISKGPVRPGLVEEIEGPLEICTRRALHATELPPKWKGERVWCVALFGEFQQEDDKFGALKREIIGECL